MISYFLNSIIQILANSVKTSILKNLQLLTYNLQLLTLGIAELNEETQTLTISAHLYFYGNAANEEISFQAGADIKTHWNIAGAHARIKEKSYKVLFNVKGLYKQDLSQTEVISNDDPRNNYFRIEDYASGNISFVDGIGSNTGYFKLDNLLNNSTTAAHEFGHTLGLLHPEQLDIRGKGVPGIMYPRGTVCDPMFQYDPNAAPLAPGGTMNPFYRKVLQKDIDDLHLNKLRFNKDGRAVIGEFTSVWHYAHTAPQD